MYLARLGFERVANLSGGIDLMVGDGRPCGAALLNLLSELGPAVMTAKARQSEAGA